MPNNDIRAVSVSQFCKRNSISRTMVYKEAQAGRLRIHKLGRKALIMVEDEAAWREALPVFTSGASYRKGRRP
jgi:excisionase family DNA binding protein